MEYEDYNSKIIDSWIREGWEWGKPVEHSVIEKAREGDWSVLLTPTKSVPHSWFLPFEGLDVLGLASGGGQQMPIFASLGARCTVLDYSELQLESEKAVARREGYSIRLVRANMAEPLPFADGSFDLIFHPVSNCYIRDVYPLWRECYRVLRKGGRLLAGLDNGINYIVDENHERIVRGLPFDPIAENAELPAGEAYEFSHSAEEQIGGQLKAGFTLLDIYSDTNGYGRLDKLGIPSFWATLAEKR